MNAIQLLRQMHADSKVRFKVILGAVDPKQAAAQWGVLQSLLELHEQLEDDFVYTPLFEEMGPGTPLGDWSFQHDADVATVKQFIQAAGQLEPATPAWRATIGTIMDALNKHVMDEEGQIFGRIEQVWDSARLEQAGQQMEKMKDSAARATEPRSAAVKSSKRRGPEAATQARRSN
ncbi:MAG: hemerythrin domain-containing protein [Chloroflexota bacterium]|nr:hemerythrin domain-containing protein [Chloroflexota bacterium]